MAREVRRFGEFTLDVSAEHLFRSKYEMPLQPQPLKLLILLTSRPGHIFTRQEIQEALWPKSKGVTVDFEQGLRFAIRQVRAALGDNKDRPTYIETERGIGYRFKCAVDRRLEEDAASGPAFAPGTEKERESPPPKSPIGEQDRPTAKAVPVLPPATAEQAKRPRHRHLTVSQVVILVGVGALAVAVAFTFWRSYHRVVSLAVLPTLNLTQSSSYNGLADDFTVAMAQQIRMVNRWQIHVIEANLADLPKENWRNPVAAAKALGADYVLSCTLSKAAKGPGLVLFLEVFRRGSDQPVWDRWSEVDQDHIMTFVDELSAEAVRALPVLVKPEAHTSRYISSPAAEGAYNRGRREFAERTQEGINAALDDFKTATQIDPRYAKAHAELAMTYEQLGGYGWMPQADAARKAGEETEQALLLDPELPEGLAARGYEQWFYHWNWKDAKRDLEHAIRVDNQNVNALHWHALVLATAGNTGEAEQQLERALELEPKSKILRTNRGWLDYFAGRPEEAAARMEEVLREDGWFLSASLKLWAVYSFEHRDDDAFRELKRLSEADLSEETREDLDHIRTTEGYPAAVRQWSKEQAESTRGNTLFRAQLAEAGADHEAAVQILLDACRKHDGWVVFSLRDPMLRSAVEDQRFRRTCPSLFVSSKQ